MSEPTLDSALVVFKFGSSVLQTAADLPLVVHAIYRQLRAGRAVIAVVSALGDTTDRLLAEARALGAADDHATAALLATGEAQSVALLALALARAGVPAHTADARALGLRTRGAVLDAEPIELDVAFVRRCLAERPVLVVPGFVGVDAKDRVTLLGRGGSDLSAVFLAATLGARSCVLCKDVDGLYDRDPALAPGEARRFAYANHADALRFGGRLVQSKAIDAARKAGIAFTIASLHGVGGTCVGAGASSFAAAAVHPSPLRVGVLGLGTVGGGVCERLLHLPEQFVLVGAAVRDGKKARAPALASIELASDAASLATRCDVLVDATGDVDTLAPTLRTALSRGVHVVSANKALLAGELSALHAAASVGGSRLLTAAAVGGAVPMLELACRLRAVGVERVEAILNTTTQFVLCAVATGQTLSAALSSARAAGFAEAEVTRDLDGKDAADKLVLLAHAAFGVVIARESIARVDVRALDAARLQAGARAGREVRVVASLHREGDQVVAALVTRELLAGDPLFATPHDGNRIVVRTRDGNTHCAAGVGAGRWPTTEAVLGDLLALAHQRSAPSRPVACQEVTAEAPA